jgi:hypothetical protein
LLLGKHFPTNSLCISFELLKGCLRCPHKDGPVFFNLADGCAAPIRFAVWSSPLCLKASSAK